MTDMIQFFIDRGDWSAVFWSVIGLLSIPTHFVCSFFYCWRNHGQD